MMLSLNNVAIIICQLTAPCLILQIRVYGMEFTMLGHSGPMKSYETY